MIRTLRSLGTGRTFVVLHEVDQHYASYADAVTTHLASDAKVILLESEKVTETNWRELSAELLNFLKESGVRQASYIGFGGACSLVQNIYLREPKIVRTLTLVDAASQPHPTSFSRTIDWLEEKFPLGLPLRSASKGFDVRSHLQRIRCPVLVTTTPGANEFLTSQAHAANRAMPSSWFVELDNQDAMGSLCGIVKEFQEVPAKCPQKNRAL